MTDIVCYFIQTHRDPEQIYRLVRTLRRGSPNGLIVVQHNPVGFELAWRPLADLPGTYLMPPCAPQLGRAWPAPAIAPAWSMRRGALFGIDS